MQAEIVQLRFDFNFLAERDELFRQLDQFDQVLRGEDVAPLRLFDLVRAGEQRIEIAELGDELRRRLHANAARAGNVVGRIARKRLDVDDPVRSDAEIGKDLFFGDPPLVARAGLSGNARSRIVHRDAGPDQLHHVLVGGDDQHVGAVRARHAGISRDEIVGFPRILLDRHKTEGAHRLAHQRKLRDQVFRRLVAVRFVGGIELAPERILGLVEDDGEMRRLDAGRALQDELEKLRAEQPHRARRQAVGAVIVFRIVPDRLEIGAEDEG